MVSWVWLIIAFLAGWGSGKLLFRIGLKELGRRGWEVKVPKRDRSMWSR